jgi:RNA polymerase sigma-70 factor (ECF subfamily)
VTYSSLDAAITAAADVSATDGVPYSHPMTETPDDAALMLRYKDGDLAAFELLYRRHQSSLYRYLLRLCPGHDTTDDIFQETWAKIIKSRHNYRPTAKFRTFLFRVAYNCFIDHVRRNKRYAIGSAGDPDSYPSTTDEPDVSTERLLARQKLDVALRSLPDDQRNAFLMREEAGLSLKQIAQITGVGRETAKSRLRYATKKLHAALQLSMVGHTT